MKLFSMMGQAAAAMPTPESAPAEPGESAASPFAALFDATALAESVELPEPVEAPAPIESETTDAAPAGFLESLLVGFSAQTEASPDGQWTMKSGPGTTTEAVKPSAGGPSLVNEGSWLNGASPVDMGSSLDGASPVDVGTSLDGTSLVDMGSSLDGGLKPAPTRLAPHQAMTPEPTPTRLSSQQAMAPEHQGVSDTFMQEAHRVRESSQGMPTAAETLEASVDSLMLEPAKAPVPSLKIDTNMGTYGATRDAAASGRRPASTPPISSATTDEPEEVTSSVSVEPERLEPAPLDKPAWRTVQQAPKLQVQNAPQSEAQFFTPEPEPQTDLPEPRVEVKTTLAEPAAPEEHIEVMRPWETARIKQSKVQLTIDDDLSVEVEGDGLDVHVRLEGTEAALDPLRDVGPELRDALAQQGFNLGDMDFSRRESTGEEGDESNAEQPAETEAIDRDGHLVYAIA